MSLRQLILEGCVYCYVYRGEVVKGSGSRLKAPLWVTEGPSGREGWQSCGRPGSLAVGFPLHLRGAQAGGTVLRAPSVEGAKKSARAFSSVGWKTFLCYSKTPLLPFSLDSHSALPQEGPWWKGSVLGRADGSQPRKKPPENNGPHHPQPPQTSFPECHRSGHGLRSRSIPPCGALPPSHILPAQPLTTPPSFPLLCVRTLSPPCSPEVWDVMRCS